MIEFVYNDGIERNNIIKEQLSKNFLLVEDVIKESSKSLIFEDKSKIQQENFIQDDYLLDIDYRLSLIELGL